MEGKGMEGQRKQYSAEFKQEAVRLVSEGGLSLSQAAQQLGVNRNLLAKWKRHLAAAYEAQTAGRSGYEAFPGQGRAHDAELARLRREVAALKMERDVLKKAISIFAEPPHK
jgi:transposase